MRIHYCFQIPESIVSAEFSGALKLGRIGSIWYGPNDYLQGRVVRIEQVETLNETEQQHVTEWWRRSNEALFGADVVASASASGAYQAKFTFKAVDDDELIGITSGICSLGLGYIHELIVNEEYWGKGIGGLLLSQAEEFCYERGARRLALRAPANAPAVAFYKKRGWAMEFENIDWYGGQVYLQMRKDLKKN